METESVKLIQCAAFVLVFISGCAVNQSRFLTFSNPLNVGDQVSLGKIVITCSTREGARYMTRTGFYHPGCQRVITDEAMRVVSREFEHLGEGGMWLLRVRSISDSVTWIVLPWHDWA